MYIKINKDKIFNIKYNELSVASIIFRLKTSTRQKKVAPYSKI